MFLKKDRLAKLGQTFYLQGMKTTPHQSAAISFPSDLQPSQADHLLYFLDHRCELSALRDHFSLTSLQVLQFLAAPAVKQALDSIKDSVHSVFTISALRARDFAIDKLHIVCHDLVRQAAITAGAAINEVAQAKTINSLRLASSQIGRLASATINPPKSARRSKPTISEINLPADVSARTDLLNSSNPTVSPSISSSPVVSAAPISALDRLKLLNSLPVESPQFLEHLSAFNNSYKSEVLQSLCARKFPRNPQAQKLFNQVRAINAGGIDPFNRTMTLLSERLPELVRE